MAAPEELTRDELVELARRLDAQITMMAGQMAELLAANEALSAKLAQMEHLLSRNSRNSSWPPSKDDDLGKTPPAARAKRAGSGRRKKGKQPGAPGANLAWADVPGDHQDRFPEGVCECGHDLAGACDLGVVDRYQQHEIPAVSVKVTQYDQHAVRCGCGRVHTAVRPEGARRGAVGTDPTCRLSRSISWWCTSFPRTAASNCWSR